MVKRTQINGESLIKNIPLKFRDVIFNVSLGTEKGGMARKELALY